VREHISKSHALDKHGEPWGLAEDLEQRTGITIPKQLAYFG
jgi:hypothetical protein